MLNYRKINITGSLTGKQASSLSSVFSHHFSFVLIFLWSTRWPVTDGRGRRQRGACVRMHSCLTQTLFSLSASEMPHYTLVNSLATTLPIWPVPFCLHSFLLAHTQSHLFTWTISGLPPSDYLMIFSSDWQCRLFICFSLLPSVWAGCENYFTVNKRG